MPLYCNTCIKKSISFSAPCTLLPAPCVLYVVAMLYNIRSMSQELTLFDAVAAEPRETPTGLSYAIITNEATLEKVLSDARGKVIALDLETTGFDPYGDAIVGISLSWEEKHACYIPVGHKRGRNLSLDAARKILQPALSGAKVVFHNAKFDWKFLRVNGIDADIFADTMIMAHLVDAGQSVALKECSKRYFSETMTYFNELFGKDAAHDFSSLLPEEGYLYACADADVTLRLYNYLTPKIAGMDFLRDMDMRLIPCLAESELSGLEVDRRALDKMTADVQKEINFLRDTSRDAQKLKAVEKIKAAVLEPVKKQMNPDTGMIYPNWFQFSTKTARLSARDFSFDETKEEKLFPQFSRYELLVPGGHFLSFAAEFTELETQLFYKLFSRNTFTFSSPRLAELFREISAVDALAENFSSEGRERLHRLSDEARKGNKITNLFGRGCPLDSFVLTAPESRKSLEALRSYIRATAWDILRFASVRVAECARKNNVNAHFVFAATDHAVFVVHEDEDLYDLLNDAQKAIDEMLAEFVPVSYGFSAGKKFKDMQAVTADSLCVKLLFSRNPTAPEIETLKDWLAGNPGTQNVYLRAGGKLLYLGDSYRTKTNPLLFEELRGVIVDFAGALRTVKPAHDI